MSIEADLILEKVHHLSLNELLTVQETITRELRDRISSNKDLNNSSTTIKPTNRRIEIPGSYRPTREQIEARLKSIFTPEQLAEMDKVDLTNLPPGSKTVTEMLNEDREDRF